MSQLLTDTFNDYYPEGGMSPGPSEPYPHDNNRDGLVISDHRADNQRGKPIFGSFVEFINCGSTVVWLDESIPIMPGGYYSCKNPCYDVSWAFDALSSPPTPKSKYIQSGNRLKIRIHKTRDAYAYLSQGLADISTGNITVNTSPPVATNLVAVNDTIATDLNLPAAIIRGKIKNLGGDSPANITVNGQELAPGDEYELGAFYAGDKLYLPPAYNVVANGSLWSYYYEK